MRLAGFSSILLTILFFLLQSSPAAGSTSRPSGAPMPERNTAYQIYARLIGANKPAFTPFAMAFTGYQKLQHSGLVKEPVLTVVDFSLPSSQKRMWIIDMSSQEILHHTFVAHGKNSGTLMAERFSNRAHSLQSSLGFYLTTNVYHGKHGRSLRLNGMEPGINDKARERAIVLHGADYATAGFVARQGRLGRSYGCPAVPTGESDQIIDWLKEGSVLFIYHASPSYTNRSTLVSYHQ